MKSNPRKRTKCHECLIVQECQSWEGKKWKTKQNKIPSFMTFIFSSLFKTQQLVAHSFYPLPSLLVSQWHNVRSHSETLFSIKVLCSSKIPDSQRSPVHFTDYSKHKGCLTCILIRIIIITIRIIIS